jgi:hypothetical protein
MQMDTNNLMASLIFGMIGMGMFMYGKRAGSFIPLMAGLLLMVVPYFIPNLIAMVVVSTLLVAAPAIVRGS